MQILSLETAGNQKGLLPRAFARSLHPVPVVGVPQRRLCMLQGTIR